MPPTPSSPRRRGGQPGNTNALKYGLTTRNYPPVPVPRNELESVPPILGFAEENELVHLFFLCMNRLFPEKEAFVTAFPVFRRAMNILFLQAAGIRALHPLTSDDYALLAANLEQLLRLIMGV